MAAPRPFGPFFDKNHMEKLHAHAAASLSTKGPEVNAAVKAAAPVGPARATRPGGELRGSISTKVQKRKNGVAIVVTADAKNEQGNHYGVFVNAKTNVFEEALVEASLEPLEDAIVDFVNDANGTENGSRGA